MPRPLIRETIPIPENTTTHEHHQSQEETNEGADDLDRIGGAGNCRGADGR